MITDLSLPRPNQEGVGVDQVFQIIFSEPVTNILPSSVDLRSLGGTLVPTEIIGSGPDGVAPIEPDHIVTALTIRPLRGLEFDKSYEFLLTGEIVDTDEDPPGTPKPNALTPDPTEINFSTFTPQTLSQVDADQAIGAVIVKERAYVLLNTFPGSVRTFDIADPSRPTRFGSEDNRLFGIARDILGEEDVDLGQGITDIVATFSINTFSGQGLLTVMDVGRGMPPFGWATVVTTSSTGEVTLGVDIHRSFAYVAASDDGLKVFDLARAADLYRATKPPDQFDPGFDIRRRLFSKGPRLRSGSSPQHDPAVRSGGNAPRQYGQGRGKSDRSCRLCRIFPTNGPCWLFQLGQRLRERGQSRSCDAPSREGRIGDGFAFRHRSHSGPGP